MPPDSQIAARGLDARNRMAKLVGVGIAFIAVLFSFVVYQYGLLETPKGVGILTVGPWAALVAAVLLLLAWVVFPLKDLAFLDRWLLSDTFVTPADTVEALFVLLGSTLVVGLILAARDPTLFAAAGMALFAYNFLGFARIRSFVGLAASDAMSFCERCRTLAQVQRETLVDGITLTKRYWGIDEGQHWLRNPQQIRHGALTGSFAVALLLAIIGKHWESMSLQLASYALGVCALVTGEVVLAFWRIRRDSSAYALSRRLGGLPEDVLALSAPKTETRSES